MELSKHQENSKQPASPPGRLRVWWLTLALAWLLVPVPVWAALTLDYFRATPNLAGVEVLLEWKSANEPDDFYQFYVQRALNSPTDFITIYDTLVGPGSGTTFSHRDGSVEVGPVYYYKLLVVNSSGDTETYGPISTTLTRAATATPIPSMPPQTSPTPTPSPTLTATGQHGDSPLPTPYPNSPLATPTTPPPPPAITPTPTSGVPKTPGAQPTERPTQELITPEPTFPTINPEPTLSPEPTALSEEPSTTPETSMPTSPPSEATTMSLTPGAWPTHPIVSGDPPPPLPTWPWILISSGATGAVLLLLGYLWWRLRTRQ